MAKQRNIIYNYKDLAKVIAAQYGIRQQDVIDILATYFKLVRQLLLEGNQINFPNLGTMRHATRNKREEKIVNNVLPNEDKDAKWVVPERPAHNIPVFKFNKTVIEEMEEKTSGDLYQ